VLSFTHEYLCIRRDGKIIGRFDSGPERRREWLLYLEEDRGLNVAELKTALKQLEKLGAA
jgi:hypothetical protein